VVTSSTVTSTLDWTNTSYAIYVAASNGSAGTPGATGANGLAALTAYKVQSQSTAAPGTPSNTTGPTAPATWSLTAPAVTVGDVLWYTFGQYNSSTGTISGIPAGQTQWGTPTAASVFQDIRSDNWNGGTPPTTGPFAPLGTAGYYIQRQTGNMYLNSVYGRGVAQFDGYNNAGGTVAAILANYSGTQTNGIYANAGPGGAGVYASGASGNVAVEANGLASTGINASTYGTTAYGGYFVHSNSSYPAAYLWNGTFKINNSSLVTNLNAQYLNGNTSSAFATVASGADAYAANRLNGSAGLNVLRFVQGTLTGTATAGFSGTNKPGSTSSNVWIQITIDGTTLYIPAWT